MGFRDHFRTSSRRTNGERTPSSASSSITAGKNTTGTTTPNHTIDNHTLSPTKTQPLADKDKETSPAITLTKSHSLLGKTLTWHTGSSSSSSKASKKDTTKEKQIKAWAKQDAVEWSSPMSHRPGKKDAGCQDTLRAFDFRKAALGGENEGKGRSMSNSSGVSPSQSRVGSVDDGLTLGQMKEKRHSSDKARPGKLSQDITREAAGPEKTKMGGLTEE